MQLKTALEFRTTNIGKRINDNDNDNNNEIDLFRHHNGNNTNIKVIFKQMTMLHKCNCI